MQKPDNPLDIAGCSSIRMQLRADAPSRELRARRGGWFWLPCPICKEPFAGYEASTRLSVPNGPDGGSNFSMTCPACEFEVGVRESATCREHGHVPQQVWGMTRTEQTRNGDRHTVSGTIDLGGLPTERYCQVCFVDLPIGENDDAAT